MEVLKNMNEKELGQLRAEFDEAEQPGALNIDEFKEVLGRWSRKKRVPFTEDQLEVLFSDIDVNGDATVEWEEFTMFLITGETTNRGENPIKDYHVASVSNTEVPGSVADCRFIPKINKVLKLIKRDNYGKVKFCMAVEGLPVIGETPRNSDGVLGAEYIPPPDKGTFFGKNAVKEYSLGHVIAVSYPDSTVRFYDLNRRDSVQKELFQERRLIQFSESQNMLRWSHHHNKLFCGSRSGIISTCSPDSNQATGKEKLHAEGVSDIVLSRDTMYSCSVDGSIKCTDLAKGQVRYGLKHDSGILHLAVNNEHLQLFSTGFEQHATVYSLQLPKLQHKLEDKHRPHHGRIVGLEVIPRTPQLLTADSTGLVKVWDIRMYQCVQSIMTVKDRDASTTTNILSSIAAMPHVNQVIVNGRDCKIFEYDASSNPHLSDDHQVSQIHYNDQVHSFLTVHQDTLKIWDGDTGVMKGAYVGVVPSDITAVCIVPPKARKMFVGTLSGNIYGVGYAVCSVFRTLPRLSTTDSHVVCLEYLETIKDSHNPYLLVAFATEIALFPDTDEHVKRATLPLHCLDEVLGSSHITNVAALTSGSILVCTNGGVMHLVDLATFSVTVSWKEGLIGDLQCIAHMKMDFSIFSSLAIVADGGGQLTCTLQRTGQSCNIVACWSNMTPSAYEEAAEEKKMRQKKEYKSKHGMSPPPDSEPPSPTRDASGHRLTTPGSKRLLTAGLSIRRGSGMPSLKEQEELNHKVISILGPRPNSAVAGYFTQKRSVVYSASVGCMTIIDSLQLLVTGDEKGQVTIWDISQVILKANFLLTGHRHVLVKEEPHIEVMRTWNAHENGIVALTAHPSKSDPDHWIITTAGEDKQVILWSLDGVALGNLSQDRKDKKPKKASEEAAEEDGLLAGMLPFTAEVETPEGAWSDAVEFMEERTELLAELKSQALDPPPLMTRNQSLMSVRRPSIPHGPPVKNSFKEAAHRLVTPGDSATGKSRRERREEENEDTPTFFQLTDVPRSSAEIMTRIDSEGLLDVRAHTDDTVSQMSSMSSFPAIKGALPSERKLKGLVKEQYQGAVTARVPNADVRREQTLPPRPPPAPNSARNVGTVVPVEPHAAAHENIMNRIAPPKKTAISSGKRKLTNETKAMLSTLDSAHEQVTSFFLTDEQRSFVDRGSVVLGTKRGSEESSQQPSSRTL